MAKKNGKDSPNGGDAYKASSTVEELLLAALERGGDTLETGRYLVTFKEGAAEEGLQSLGTQGMRVADTRDFENQAITMETVGDADAIVFPEIGVALVSGNAAQERSMGIFAEIASDSPIASIDPEYFVFPEHTNAPPVAPPYDYLQKRNIQTAEDMPTGYLRGFYGQQR
jgi:hypothetical protein